MSKPWETELTKDQLGRFESILSNLKVLKTSTICPFNPRVCDRSRPTCADLVKGLKKINLRRACPCYKFRTTSLIWRIKKLLDYNNFVQSQTNEVK